MTSRNIWFISDTHFGHANIIKYCNRPFSSVEEMDDCMIQKWNSVVKDGDSVYHLGDVYFGGYHSPESITKILKSLKGRKRLVVGNHDDLKDPVLHECFSKISMWRFFKEQNILATHVPLHETSLYNKGLNIHGHIHTQESPEGPYRNLCVEKINYTPIHMEELIWKKAGAG